MFLLQGTLYEDTLVSRRSQGLLHHGVHLQVGLLQCRMTGMATVLTMSVACHKSKDQASKRDPCREVLKGDTPRSRFVPPPFLCINRW